MAAAFPGYSSRSSSVSGLKISLFDAASCGDEDAIRSFVAHGADVNELDSDGRSIIGSLILGAKSLDDLDASLAFQASAPARLAILTFLLSHRKFSLLSLNAPQDGLRGLTPLGMAAYLNQLDFVSALLEKGHGLVLIDGVDLHRATPLMYAARDGHLNVVEYLLRKGAKPDAADCNYRSVMFYSVSDPLCLWSCENALRQKRAKSLQSPNKKRKLKLSLQLDVDQYSSLLKLYQKPSFLATQTKKSFRRHSSSVQALINAIVSSDYSVVHSLLFPGIESSSQSPTKRFSPTRIRSRKSSLSSVLAPSSLVNLRDSRGWSPIHYCVTSAEPNVKILDTLYLAGADVTLYTADNTHSPLHCLARSKRDSGTSFQLYSFIVHFIQDLGAPLDACDLEGNTCIHIAAEHGHSPDILMAFLDCDTSGSVRKMQNSDGLTAFDIAKPEFRIAFGTEENFMRPASVASVRTVKPSLSSLSSASSPYGSPSSSTSDLSLCQSRQFPASLDRSRSRAELLSGSARPIELFFENLRVLTRDLQRAESDGFDLDIDPIDPIALNNVDLDDLASAIHDSTRGASEILEQFRVVVDDALEDLKLSQSVRAELNELVRKLEGRLRRSPYGSSSNVREVAALTGQSRTGLSRERGNSLGAQSLRTQTSFASLTPPSLARSSFTGSNSSFSSESSIATPPTSPSFIDFGLAIHTGQRLGYDHVDHFDGISPLQTVAAVGQAMGHSEVDDLAETIKNTSPFDSARTSWDNASESTRTLLRKKSTEILKEHLANLIEIEKTLFGDADSDEELDDLRANVLDCDTDAAEAHVVADLRRDSVTARRPILGSIDADHSTGSSLRSRTSGIDGNDTDLNRVDRRRQGLVEEDFLDLFTATHEAEGDLDHPIGSAGGDGITTISNPRWSDTPPSPLEIIEIAKREIEIVSASMKNVEEMVEGALKYLSLAERLTHRIFQDKEHDLQAARLSQALRELAEGDLDFRPDRCMTPEQRTITPASSPVVQISPSADRLTFASSATTRASVGPKKRPSMQSLYSPANEYREEDDTRLLRRLLTCKVPERLEGVCDELDRVGIWVGVVQDVLKSLKKSLSMS